jgi:peroxiredoxin Q/BCP
MYLMRKIAVGDVVPDISFECTAPGIQSFKDLKGKNIVLYFYPKDNTPGCTTEGKDFRDLHESFSALNTQVLGVSRDTLVCHQKFKSKLGLPFALITDKDEKLCQTFGVLIETNMFMRLLIGIDRSTFLIDDQGILRQEWRKVRVKGHAAAVLEAVRKLSQNKE